MSENYKKDFPLLLQREENGLPIAYLDNAATTQKPVSVIDAVSGLYKSFNANSHRGSYFIAEKMTQRFERVRAQVAHFIGAVCAEEVVFTGGTTDAVNLAALTYGNEHIREGEEILVSIAEHHSNLLPWQRLARGKSARLIYLYPDERGQISPGEVEKKCSRRTRLLAIAHVSNVLGAVNPIKEIAEIAHRVGAVVFVDGAQSTPHIPVNVQEMDADFMAFSGHKMLAPAGIGVLYGKAELLKQMQPLRVGGGAVEYVGRYDAGYLETPWRFEAGTQNAEGVIGLGAAIDYLDSLSLPKIQKIENELLKYALEKITDVQEVSLYGPVGSVERTGIITFNVKGIHPHDTAAVLASHGVAVRAGHHCAQPLMQYLGVNAACRMSLYFYNTRDDVDRMIKALKTVRGVFGYEA